MAWLQVVEKTWVARKRKKKTFHTRERSRWKVIYWKEGTFVYEFSVGVAPRWLGLLARNRRCLCRWDLVSTSEQPLELIFSKDRRCQSSSERLASILQDAALCSWSCKNRPQKRCEASPTGTGNPESSTTTNTPAVSGPKNQRLLLLKKWPIYQPMKNLRLRISSIPGMISWSGNQENEWMTIWTEQASHEPFPRRQING